MSKKPSEKTQLATARRQIKELSRSLLSVTHEREKNLARAMYAEQQASEWKQRFDTLLNRVRPPLSEEKNRG